MIAHLEGVVRAVAGTHVVLDLNGFGIRVECTPATASAVRLGESTLLYTALIVREDSMTVYGFVEADERDCFELSLTASGVGPRIAQAMMAVLGADGFREAIAAEDHKRLAQTPGIGVKTAQKIILELKDKVHAAGAVTAAGPGAPQPWQQQVAQGLEGLGWSAKEAQAACESIEPLAETETNVAVLIRAALQTLAKQPRGRQ